jgi:hypothetical protein
VNSFSSREPGIVHSLATSRAADILLQSRRIVLWRPASDSAPFARGSRAARATNNSLTPQQSRRGVRRPSPPTTLITTLRAATQFRGASFRRRVLSRTGGVGHHRLQPRVGGGDIHLNFQVRAMVHQALMMGSTTSCRRRRQGRSREPAMSFCHAPLFRPTCRTPNVHRRSARSGLPNRSDVGVDVQWPPRTTSARRLRASQESSLSARSAHVYDEQRAYRPEQPPPSERTQLRALPTREAQCNVDCGLNERARPPLQVSRGRFPPIARGEYDFRQFHRGQPVNASRRRSRSQTNVTALSFSIRGRSGASQGMRAGAERAPRTLSWPRTPTRRGPSGEPRSDTQLLRVRVDSSFNTRMFI